VLTPPLKPRTKEEYAYDVLREAILRCELKPGEKLVIDSLSDKLGVSAIPLRGALQRLQSEGLVEITPHTGAIVSELSPANIEQVSLLLERLEILAFEIVARIASDADIAALRTRLEEMDHLLQAQDLEHWSELNIEFHRAVANLTEMKLLIEFTHRALDAWMRLRRWYLQRIFVQMPQSQAEHREMIELLARRDTAQLTRVVVAHNRRMRESYQQAINHMLDQSGKPAV
jgi:DNA-binding GntR family transcriptional regulator